MTSRKIADTGNLKWGLEIALCGEIVLEEAMDLL
jgi:hypothetical protein